MLNKGDLLYSDMCKLNFDISEISNYSIIDIYKSDCACCTDDENDEYTELDTYSHSCVGCFFSNGIYCKIKDIEINKQSPLCWLYKDCLTMRTLSDFQDDNEDFCDMY